MDEAPCDDCERCSSEGYAYCMKCGRPIASGLKDDGVPKDNGPKKNDTLTMLVRVVGLIILVACTAMLVFEIYTVFWTASGIWTGMEGYRLGILALVPSPVILFYVSGIFAKFYYLFIVASVLVSFVLLIFNSRNGIAEAVRGKLDKLDEMPLYGVVTMFAMYISINLILVLIVTSAGYTPAELEDPDEKWKLWYSLLNASVWEEVICRVLMIGVPLMVAGIALQKKGSWKLLFGRSDMNGFAVAFILISSTVFSYGHLDGWDLFKMIPTFICGLALGYLFVRFGLYASIMLHFLIDFLSSFTWVFDGLMADAMLGLFILAMVALGVPFIILYAVRGIRHLGKLLPQ